ncbi:MAG: hypothetical protein ABII22_01055 [Candidatus Micrarchaeota archaeon]
MADKQIVDSEISFETLNWCCEGNRGKFLDEYKRPYWAVMTGFTNMIWLDKKGQFSENSPMQGATCRIKVKNPFRIRLPERFWALFYPESSEEEYLDSKTRIVECIPKKVIEKNEKEGIIEIKVNQSIPINELGDYIKENFDTETLNYKETADGDPIIQEFKDPNNKYADKYTYRASKKNDLLSIEQNHQGDVVFRIICQKSKEGYDIFLYDFSGFHESFFYAGNKRLNENELEIVKKYCDLNKIKI